MLPYLPAPRPIHLLGVSIPVFGLFLFAAALIAHLGILRRGRALRLATPALLERFAAVLVLSAILGAHITGVIGDRGCAALLHPNLFLSTDGTLSSAGGFLGALVAGGLFIRRYRPQLGISASADLAAHVFPFAWLVARAGCALAHDHPGRLSTSVLAIAFPEGPRLDCGLLEALATPLLIALVLVIGRRPRPAGLLAAVVAAAYASIRFPLDFFRATDLPGSDPRHSGLTAAQWGCLALFAAAVYGLGTVAKKARSPLPVP